MLDFDLFAINTEKSEYSSSVDELYASFEEAMEHRMEYANWWRPYGDVWIERYKAGEGFRVSETWHIREDGTIASHYVEGRQIHV